MAVKIYNFVGAPNPKKLRVYLSEKGLLDTVEMVQVDFTTGEQRSDAFRKEKNPFGNVPVLELDNGHCYPESLAIIEYFEELNPDPPMIGTTPEERLRVRMLERVCEMRALFLVSRYVHNTSAFFAKRVNQSEEVAAVALKGAHKVMRVLDDYIGDNEFVAGDKPTIADCTLLATLWFAHVMKMPLELEATPNVLRWNKSFRERPSAKA
jgi:glutathione S-transferase